MVNGKSTGCIDLEQFWENYGDMKDDLPALVSVFASQCAPAIKKIRAALDTKNAAALRASAHGFKGALLQIFAKDLAKVALALEKKGAAAEWELTEELFEQLAEGVAALIEELKHFDFRRSA